MGKKRSSAIVCSIAQIQKLLGGAASQVCFNPPTGKYCVSGKCLRDYEFQSVLSSSQLLTATRNDKTYWISLQFLYNGATERKVNKEMNRFQQQIETIQQLSKLKLVPRYVDSWGCNCPSKCFMMKENQKEKRKIQTVMVTVYKAFGIPLRQYIRQFGTTYDIPELNQQIIAHHGKVAESGIALEDINLDRIFIRPISKQIRFLPNRYKQIDNPYQRMKHLFQLTKNDLEQNFKRQYKFIQGPVTLTEHYDKKRDLRVYIFGDQHQFFNQNCPKSISIEDYFRQILRFNPDKIIDIYLEAPLVENESISKRLQRLKNAYGQGFLFENVRKEWKECLLPDKALCSEPNLRLHYTDVRKYVSALNYMDQSIRRLKRLVGQQTKLKSSKGITKLSQQLQYIIDDFEQIKQDYPLGLVVSELLETTKVNKQLNSIIDDAKAVKILKQELIEKGMKKYLKSLDFKKIDTILKKLRKNKTVSQWKKSKPDIQKLKDLGDFMVYLMDIYTMGRLFRSYTNKKLNQNQYAERAKYAVIYVGDHHARNYRGVMDKLGFKQVKKTSAEKTQCLNVSKFHQPFFTQS